MGGSNCHSMLPSVDVHLFNDVALVCNVIQLFCGPPSCRPVDPSLRTRGLKNLSSWQVVPLKFVTLMMLYKESCEFSFKAISFKAVTSVYIY